MKAMNTSDVIHPYNIETAQIAQELNTTIASASFTMDTDMVVIQLYNGIHFTIYYLSTPSAGWIYVNFNGTNYNYTILNIRNRMFSAMRNWLKERKQNADNGEDSGF